MKLRLNAPKTLIDLAGLGLTGVARVGDAIVLAPSGFNALEAEKVTLTAVTGNSVSFTPALRCMNQGHFLDSCWDILPRRVSTE